MQAADVGRAMALNIWCLRLCCGCCWGVPQQCGGTRATLFCVQRPHTKYYCLVRRNKAGVGDCGDAGGRHGARRQRHYPILLAPQALLRALLCHGSVVACAGALGACCSGALYSGPRRRASSLPLYRRHNKAAGTKIVVMQAADVGRATCITLLAPHVLLRARVRMVCHGSAVAGALGAAVAATHVLDAVCAH